jgi:hypothetical protein
MLESIASFVGGTPIPPGAEISYPVPQSANSTGFKPGDSIEAFVYLCIEYTDMLTAPPKRHHYCSVEEFVTDQGKREFIASGTVKGRFEFTNGGCAD